MKKNRILTSLLMCAIAGLMCFAANGQTVRNGKAKVVRMKGHARFTTGNNVWQPVKVGDVYSAGTIIQTDQSSGTFVDLILADGSGAIANTGGATPTRELAPITANVVSYKPRAEQNTLHIYENTAIGIDRLTSMQTPADVVTDTQLDLRAGHIMGNVKKMSATSKYEIKLPNGVAGIRGTVYALWATGLFQIDKGSGAISILGPNNELNSKNVPPGYEFDPSTGDIRELSPSDRENLDRNAFSTSTTASVAYFAPDQTVNIVSEGETSPTNSPPPVESVIRTK